MKNKIYRLPLMLFPILLLGILLACEYAEGQARVEAEDTIALNAAIEDLKLGRVYAGVRNLRQVLRRSPNYAAAYFYMGMVYTGMRQYDLALRYVRKAVELEPEEGAYHNQLGIILLQQKKFQEALNEFKKAAEGKLEGDREKAWRNIGIVHQNLSHWDEAIQSFKTALELKPEDLEAHLALGKAYLRRNQHEEAIQEFSTAAQLEPERTEIHALLGMAYSRTGRIAEAVEAFRKATMLNSADATAHYNLAQSLIKVGQQEAGQRELKEFLKLQKKAQEQEQHSLAVRSTFQTAVNKVGEEKLEEAKQLLTEMLEVEPNFVAGLYTLGLTLLKEEKYAEAIAPLEKAVTLDPLINAGAHFYLGSAYARTGKLWQAREATDFAIVIYEENAEYHNQLGQIYQELDLKEEAQRAFQQSLKLNEKSFGARLNLGSLALQEGKLDAALNYLKRAAEINGSDAEVRRLLGLAYLEDSQYLKGIEQYKEAVRLKPSDERLRLALAEALTRGRQFRNAERTLKEWVQLNPRSGLAHYNLGKLYASQDRFQKALGELQKAINLKAEVDLDRVYRNIGSIYSRQNKFDDALKAYKKAVEINPKLLEGHLALGDLYLRRHEYDKALAEFSTVVAVDFTWAEAHAQIGQVYLLTGHDVEAIKASQKALELDARLRGARYTLANALNRTGKAEEGQREFQRFQGLETERQTQEHRRRELEALNQEALSNLQKQEYGKAVVLFRKIADYDRQKGLACLNLGLALSKAGRHEEAIDGLHKALELNFDFPEIHRYLADEYKRLGKQEESEKEKLTHARMREERLKIEEVNL